MTCVVDTASINLTVAAGQLSADLVVDPGAGLPPNPLIVNAAGVYVIGADGWIPLPTTLAFSSADGHTYVATTSADLRSFIGPGDKIRLVQSGVPAYFFVTAIAAATITLYGGQNYVLAATPVTLPYFSKVMSPAGFNLDQTIWQEQLLDPSQRTQASPAINTWYNPGSLSLAVPIGIWRLYASVFVGVDSAASMTMFAALSTANNSASDPDLKRAMFVAAANPIGGPLVPEKTINLAAKTTYFLVTSLDTGGRAALSYRGDEAETIIRAELKFI